MTNNRTQAIIVEADELDVSQAPLQLAFFNADGTPWVPEVEAEIEPAATVAAVATANGSDPATTQALANATKTTLNDLIAKLKTAGFVASS